MSGSTCGGIAIGRHGLDDAFHGSLGIIEGDAVNALPIFGTVLESSISTDGTPRIELATMNEQDGQVSSLTAISTVRSSAKAARQTAAMAAADR